MEKMLLLLTAGAGGAKLHFLQLWELFEGLNCCCCCCSVISPAPLCPSSQDGPGGGDV